MSSKSKNAKRKNKLKQKNKKISEEKNLGKAKLMYMGKKYEIPKKYIADIPFFNNKIQPIRDIYEFDDDILQLYTKHNAFLYFVDFLKKRNEFFFLNYSAIDELDIFYDLVILIDFVSMFDEDTEICASICMVYLHCRIIDSNDKNSITLTYPEYVCKIYPTFLKILYLNAEIPSKSEEGNDSNDDKCLNKKMIKRLQPFPIMYENIISIDSYHYKLHDVLSYYFSLPSGKIKNKAYSFIHKIAHKTFFFEFFSIILVSQTCFNLLRDKTLYENCPTNIKQIIKMIMFSVDSFYLPFDNNDERADILKLH